MVRITIVIGNKEHSIVVSKGLTLEDVLNSLGYKIHQDDEFFIEKK